MPITHQKICGNDAQKPEINRLGPGISGTRLQGNTFTPC